MSAIKLQGNSSGAGTSVLQSANTASTLTQTLPTLDGATLGYLNVPVSSTSGTLVAADVGKVVSISAGIIIPASVFVAGDVVSIFNNTSGTLTITCSAVTTKIAGSDTTVTSATLAIRGVCTVLFYATGSCVLTGNVS
jgi:hypothetical protein